MTDEFTENVYLERLDGPDDDAGWQRRLSPTGPAGTITVDLGDLHLEFDRLEHGRLVLVELIDEAEEEGDGLLPQISSGALDAIGWTLRPTASALEVHREPETERSRFDDLARWARLDTERAEAEAEAMVSDDRHRVAQLQVFTAVARLETALTLEALPVALRDGRDPAADLELGIRSLVDIRSEGPGAALDHLLDPRILTEGELLLAEIERAFSAHPAVASLRTTVFAAPLEPASVSATAEASRVQVRSDGRQPRSADAPPHVELTVRDGQPVVSGGTADVWPSLDVQASFRDSAFLVSLQAVDLDNDILVDDAGRRRGPVWVHLRERGAGGRLLAAGPLTRHSDDVFGAELPMSTTDFSEELNLEVWVNPYRYPDRASLSAHPSLLALDLAALKAGRTETRRDIAAVSWDAWKDVAGMWLAAGFLDRASLAFSRAAEQRSGLWREARVFARDPSVRRRTELHTPIGAIDPNQVRCLHWHPDLGPHQ